MHETTARFFQYLRDRQTPQRGLVERAIATVTPLFEKVDAGAWRLSEASTLDREAVGKAIVIASGMPKAYVTTLALTGPPPETPVGISLPFHWELMQWIGPSFLHADALEEARSLQDAFAADVGPRLIETFVAGTGHIPPLSKALLALIDAAVATLLVPYFLFALRGETRGMDLLEPCVKLIPETVPLGSHEGVHDGWVTLVHA